MLSEDDVLIAIVECKRLDNTTDYYEVANKLGVDLTELHPYFIYLKEKGYIQSDISQIYVTSITVSKYKKAKRNKLLFVRFFFVLAKLFLNHAVQIAVGVLVAIISAIIIYHFGWQ